MKYHVLGKALGVSREKLVLTLENRDPQKNELSAKVNPTHAWPLILISFAYVVGLSFFFITRGSEVGSFYYCIIIFPEGIIVLFISDSQATPQCNYCHFIFHPNLYNTTGKISGLLIHAVNIGWMFVI